MVLPPELFLLAPVGPAGARWKNPSKSPSRSELVRARRFSFYNSLLSVLLWAGAASRDMVLCGVLRPTAHFSMTSEPIRTKKHALERPSNPGERHGKREGQRHDATAAAQRAREARPRRKSERPRARPRCGKKSLDRGLLKNGNCQMRQLRRAVENEPRGCW